MTWRSASAEPGTPKARSDAVPRRGSPQASLRSSRALTQPGEQVVRPAFGAAGRGTPSRGGNTRRPARVTQHLGASEEWPVGGDLGRVGPHSGHLLCHPRRPLNLDRDVGVVGHEGGQRASGSKPWNVSLSPASRRAWMPASIRLLLIVHQNIRAHRPWLAEIPTVGRHPAS